MIGKKYILSAVLACAPLATHAAETFYSFSSVSSIEHTSGELEIIGTLLNNTAAIVTLPWEIGYASGSVYERCEKVFNVVLSQPEAYALTVATEVQTIPGHPGFPDTLKLVFTRCRAHVKT